MDVKELIIQMYGRFCRSEQIHDFGSVQYAWLERNGVLDIDAHKDFEDQAKNIEASRAMIVFKKQDEKQWEPMAKLLCLKDLFARIKASNEPITNFLP